MLVQFPLQFNFVGKESNAKPPQSERMLVQLPLHDLRSAPVGKGSDAYQTIYRDTNEYFVYTGRMSVGSGLVSDLNCRISRANGPSSRKV
ncbi:MAG: hypothetical protein CL932_10195 [Deltaproteobacteria bacterium]|nr:hypothetical protein [Deltaproteobacteria bacterium]